MKLSLERVRILRNNIFKHLKRLIIIPLVALLLLPYFSASAELDGGWSGFRGSCAKSGQGIPAATPPMRLYWKQNVGSSFVHEVIEKNGLVFVCAETLKVFEADGDFFWEFKTDTQITSTAFVTDNTVIIGCLDGTVIGVNISSRSVDWQLKTGGKIAQGICGGSDYCYVANAYGTLFKLNTENGEIIFKITLDAPLSYGPVSSPDGLIVGDDKGKLYNVDDDSGLLKWKEQIASSRIGGILQAGKNVFFGSYDDYVYCVSAYSGNEIWNTRVNGWVDKTPVMAGDKLFVKVRETLLTSFDPKSGTMLWSKEIQPSSSELLVCDNTIYYGNNRRLSTLSSDYISHQYYEFDEEQISSISMNNGNIYLGLKLGMEGIGRVACMKPDGWISVNPKAVVETVSTTDENPSTTVTVTNIKNDNWDRTVDVGLLTDEPWLTIDKPTFTLGGGETETVTITVDPFYPGVVGRNNTTISIIQVPKRPRHIRADDRISINENENNKHTIELPLVITVEDPIAPKLCMDESEVDLGNVSVYSFKRIPLELTNCGGRTLELTLTTIAFPAWLTTSQSQLLIEPGETAKVHVGVNGLKITPEAGYQCDFRGALKIETNTNEVRTILCKTKCYGIPLPTNLSIQIGNPEIYINSDLKLFEPASYITNGRTMIPLRLVAESFFTSIDWDGSDKSITIRDCNKVIRFWIGKNTVSISDSAGNETTETIDTPPEIRDGRTFIPIRVVSEILGGIVSWDSPTKTVGIIYNP